jgi:hypothetical protein
MFEFTDSPEIRYYQNAGYGGSGENLQRALHETGRRD